MAGRTNDDVLATQWHQLMGRYQHLMCELDRELGAAHELTASEFEVLQQLAQADECSLRMNTLGESAHLSQSALSRLVTRLERDGLLARTTCDHDRRSLFVALTDAGRRRYAEARPTQRRVLREAGSDCLDTQTASSQS
ncbi:MarR family transcriptional regulator [Nocardioides sp.]|uniref:MarR family winged helix-turn-helix transcriptional regulator n=1 Tax=Nocardioides sp. TaxID=35761 RepID=UPI0031FE8170